MREVIVAAINRSLINVYSGCLNLWNGSYTHLCISDVSRDYIIRNILEINEPVQETIEMIEI